MSHVICLLNIEEDRATFTWSEGPASFEPYQLEGGIFADFKETVGVAREKLSDLVKDYLYREENVPKASLALAEAGHEVYLQMFDPGAKQARIANEVKKWLEKLRSTKNVRTLEIVVESPWSIPWNVVYDQEPDKAAFLENPQENLDRWRPFWAIRYDITGGRKVSPLRRMPFLKDPHVLLVVDPQIRDGLPPEQQKQLGDFIADNNFTTVYNKDELMAAAKVQRPDVLYWLSHATPSALVLGDEEITPRQLRKLLRKDDSDDAYNFGGIAFLNACQTVESGAAGSFFDALHSVGFSGMVGTEHQTVDTFANPLGLRFLEGFLINGEPMGMVMRSLRAHVPLGLLYGTYCPPEMCVVKNVRSTDSVSVIESLPVTGGAPLGMTDVAVRVAPPLPPEPYRSLAYYEYSDRALFAGREQDVERFATLLDDADARIIVLHGESGVGKSSFLRAGVIPYLEEECVGYRFVRRQLDQQGSEQSALFVRATNDLAGSLAQALSQFCSQPFRHVTPSGVPVEVDLRSMLEQATGVSDSAGLRQAILNDPATVSRALGCIGQQLPFAPVIVIDQCEELFTLAQSLEDTDNRNLALAMLRRVAHSSGQFKVVLALRTEYFGRLIDRLRQGASETAGVREYLLTDFDENCLVEAITRPTSSTAIPHSDEVPHEKFGFDYAEGVANEIARRIVRFSLQRHDSVLPLMQVVCNQLYQRVRSRAEKTITLDDLESIGGIEGGLRQHVELLIDELFPNDHRDQRRLKQLFTQLYLRQPDGSLTTALLPEEDVQRRWTGQRPFADLIERTQTLRLLRANTLRIGGEEERRYISLGHDALAKLAADWEEELGRGARFRKMAAIIAGVSAVALVMAILTVFALWNANVAQIAQRSAETARDDALDAVETYLDGTSMNTRLAPELRKELSEEARGFFHKFVAQSSDDDPNLRAKIARSNYNLARIALETFHDYNAAIDYCDLARRQQEELLGIDPGNLALQKELSDTWVETGNAKVRLAEQAKDEKDKHREEALDAYSKATSLRANLLQEEPQNRDYKLSLASVEMNVAFVKLSAPESRDDARRLFEKALTTLQELLAEHEDLDVRFSLGQLRYNWGRLEMRTDNPGGAKEHFQAAIEAFNTVLAERTYHDESRAMLSRCYRYLGQLQGNSQDFVAAIHHAKVLAAGPAEYRRDLAVFYWALGDVYAAKVLAANPDAETLDNQGRETAKKEGLAAYAKAKDVYQDLGEDLTDLEVDIKKLADAPSPAGELAPAAGP